MARESMWGHGRIHGELKKLDVELSKSCIAGILRRNNLPPSTERKGLTWRESLARHSDVLLCTDLFTKEIWTFCGLRCAFVLVVLFGIESLRRVMWTFRGLLSAWRRSRNVTRWPHFRHRPGRA